jgi:hypothetical protein
MREFGEDETDPSPGRDLLKKRNISRRSVLVDNCQDIVDEKSCHDIVDSQGLVETNPGLL